MSTAEKSERPEQNQELRCQSGPSAKDSVIFSGRDSSKNNGADQQRLQISDLHFDNFLALCNLSALEDCRQIFTSVTFAVTLSFDVSSSDSLAWFCETHLFNFLFGSCLLLDNL